MQVQPLAAIQNQLMIENWFKQKTNNHLVKYPAQGVRCYSALPVILNSIEKIFLKLKNSHIKPYAMGYLESCQTSRMEFFHENS